jgi:hypothetical protein
VSAKNDQRKLRHKLERVAEEAWARERERRLAEADAAYRARVEVWQGLWWGTDVLWADRTREATE